VRRVGCLFEQVVDFHALCAAARAAVRGRRRKPACARLLFDLETEVLALQRELLDGTYRPRPYRTFTVSDPKPRAISAADMRDRVVHHALCTVLEPVFERVAIFDSYACRPGKGSHAAVRRAREFTRKWPYFLKLDVRKFFETIPHASLKVRVRRLVKDPAVLRLVDLIVDHGAPGSEPGRGLPIGNLTSQHLANLYLAPLDHLVKERLRVRGYVRYMDDCLLLGASKPEAWAWEAAVRGFVEGVLGLALKSEATVVAPVSEGVPFLGFRIWPGTTRLDGARRRRFLRRMYDLGDRCDPGDREDCHAGDSARSVVGHAAHADTLGLRRSLLAGAAAPEGRCGGGTGSNRVKRGGSWNNDAGNARSANRNNNSPGNRNNTLGFRPSSSGRDGGMAGAERRRSGAARS